MAAFADNTPAPRETPDNHPPAAAPERWVDPPAHPPDWHPPAGHRSGDAYAHYADAPVHGPSQRDVENNGKAFIDNDAQGVTSSRKVTRKHADGSSTAHEGTFDAGLQKGDLAVKAGLNRVDENDIGKKTKSVGIGYGKNGVNASATSAHKTTVGDNSIERSRSISLDGGQAKLAHKHGAEWKDTEGVGHKRSTGVDVGIGEKGVTTGYQGSKTRTTADGTATTKTRALNANLGEGQFGGSFGKEKVVKDPENPDEKIKTGYNMTGNVDFAKDGKLEGASGTGTLNTGKVTFSASAGYTAKTTATEPKKVGDQWVVTYQTERGGTASAGASSSAGGGGAELSGGRTKVTSGTRLFATLNEAHDFQTHAAERVGSDSGAPTSAAAADALPVGESRGESAATNASLGANAQVDVIEVGGKVSGGKSSGETVRKVKDHVVEVTTTAGDNQGVAGTLGGGGISMGKGYDVAHGRDTTVQFDLSTDDGRAAYEEYRRSHTIGKGAKVTERGSEESKASSTTVNAFGASFKSEDRNTERHSTGDKGKIDAYTGTKSAGVSIPLGPKLEHSTSLQAVELNDKERTYEGKSVINDSEGSDSTKDLAKATGTHWGSLEGKSSGKWTVNSHLSEKDMNSFADQVLSGQSNDAMLGSHRGDAADLREALTKAGADPEARMKAITEFVSHSGASGMELFRATTGAKPAYDMLLDNDKNFSADTTADAVAGKIAGHQAALADPKADRKQIAVAIAGDVAKVRERRFGVADTRKYTDLPRELRVAELQRNDQELHALEGLRQQALAQVHGGPVPGPTGAPGHQLDAADSRLHDQRDRCETAHDTVKKSRFVHDGGNTGGTAQAARKAYGKDGLVFKGDEAGSYHDADGRFERGEMAYARAAEADRQAEQKRTEYDVNAGDPKAQGQVAPLVATLTKAANDYSLASVEFRRAEAEYQDIRGRHGDQGGMWEGYDKKLPAGA